jgi:prepilin peptidase CpaA
MMIIDAVRLLLFPALMAFAASTDLFTMTISNRVSLILVAGFLALAALYGMPLVEIGSHLAAGFVVLAAATSLWLGWGHLYEYLLYASLLGGALTLLILEFRKRSLPPALANQPWVVRLHEPAGGVPYGIALAAAALLVYPSTVWMQAPG